MPASAYLALIGPAPSCDPGDHATALAHLHRIEACLVPSLRTRWTLNELNRLHALARKWRKRAFGQEPRFELAGTADGRLSEDLEWAIRQRKRAAHGRFSAAPWPSMPDPVPTPPATLTPRQRRHAASLGGQARVQLFTRADLQRAGRLGGLRRQANRRAQAQPPDPA